MTGNGGTSHTLGRVNARKWGYRAKTSRMENGLVIYAIKSIFHVGGKEGRFHCPSSIP